VLLQFETFGKAKAWYADGQAEREKKLGSKVASLTATAAVAQTPQAFQYKNITGDGTATLKSTPGYLHSVCINTPAATGTITIYDNTAASGTKIGTITSFASVTGCFTYDVAFWTGLTVVTATATPDITVSFR
jgi:hypothetical protein